MGVLERLSTLLRANINDMLDQAEDPAIMLNQILRDMENEINKARSQVADMMAQEKLYSNDLKGEQDKSAHMEERAMYYVRQGNDAMAKEALKRKADSDSNLAVLQQQLQAQTDMVTRLRGQLDALQAKYKDALGNRDSLLARHHAAQAQQKMDQTSRDLNVTDYGNDLSRMEQRIKMEEARTGAEAELDRDSYGDSVAGRFDSEERNDTVDQQLADLKTKMGMGDSKSETPSQ
jgi:phage shock protein A